jgi:hypothetical protein
MARRTTTAKDAGKFGNLIKRSGDAIMGDRGDRVIKSARVSQRAIVDRLDKEVMQLEDKREIMLDQSPDNRYSLTPGQSFDSDKWAQDYHTLSVELVNKKVELEVARNNYKELFGEEAE